MFIAYHFMFPDNHRCLSFICMMYHSVLATECFETRLTIECFETIGACERTVFCDRLKGA